MSKETVSDQIVQELIRGLEYSDNPKQRNSRCMQTIAALRELLRLRASPSPGWRPIESAPRDGTSVLLHWPDAFEKPVSGYFDGVKWKIVYSAYAFLTQPIQWQPLPSAPAAGGAA